MKICSTKPKVTTKKRHLKAENEAVSVLSMSAEQTNENERLTKMANASQDDELREEYEEADFANASRGKYAGAYAAGHNIIRIAPDVAADFPDEKAVNDALRFVQRIAQDASRLTRRTG